MLQDVEMALFVGVSVCLIFPELEAGGAGRLVQARCQVVSFRLPDTRPSLPAFGREPFPTLSGGIDVNRYKDRLFPGFLV